MNARVVSADEPGLAVAVERVLAGAVVAFPTDTVYALAADPRTESAVRRLFELKGRSERAVAPLVAASMEQVAEIAELPSVGQRLAQTFWPGGLTLILSSRTTLPRGVQNEDGGIGLRVPDNAIARRLAAHVGFPITASSANRSGQPPAITAADVERALPNVDLVIDGGASRLGVASTVVDVTTDPPVLIREGAIQRRELELVVGNVLDPAPP